MELDRRAALRALALAGMTGGLAACGRDATGARAALGGGEVCEDVEGEAQIANLETVRRGYAALAAGDVAATAELFAEDAVFTTLDRRNNVLETLKGREEIARHFERFDVTLDDAVPLGDVVSVVHTVTDRETGASWTGALAL